MTIVKSSLHTAPGAKVTATLQAVDNWTTAHQEWVSPVTTIADSNGDWQLDLPPQSSFRDISSVWRIEHPFGLRLVAVPDTGPVFVDEIEIDGRTLPPGTPNGRPLYLLRAERGAADGVAGLGSDGKVPASQLPSGSGGSVPDASSTTKGVVQLSGDLGGTAAIPTVPGLIGKYVKPSGGIPLVDLSAGVQASLAVADASANAVAVTAALATKADVTATATALAGKAPRLQVAVAYVSTGAPEGNVPPGTSGAWVPYAGVGELSVPAAVGDFLALDLACVIVASAGSIWDVGVLVGSTLVWAASSGTDTPSPDGDPGLAPFSPPVRPFNTSAAWLTVASGHLDAGHVRFVLLSKSDGSGKIFHAASNPFRWKLENRGPLG